MSTIEQSRLKAQLRFLINRLKLLQAKKTALAKQTRRTLSQVLSERKIESARIRVENLIQEDIYVELLEALETYSELVLARSAFIKGNQINDERLDEALRVLLYTSQYTDVRELMTLKPLLAQLVSKEFVQEAGTDATKIPPKILAKVHIGIPSSELVDLYILEIARAYNVEVPGVYTPPSQTQAEPQSNPSPETSEKETDSKPAANDDIWARFAALKK